MSSRTDLRNKRLKAVAEKEGITKAEAMDLLLDLYELNNINIIIERISEQKRQGFTLSQINQIRILISYLKTIVERIEQF